jgi:hypothetical protein
VKVIGEFFLAYIPIAIIFMSIALVRMFGVQDIGNVIATLNLGGVFSFNHLFLPTFIKLVILCPVILALLIVLCLHVKSLFLKVTLYFILVFTIAMISIKVFIGNIETRLSSEWSGFFSQNYTKPSYDDYESDVLTQNIVWIYSESTEKSYKNDEILKNLESETRFMSDIDIKPLVNLYTMGAIVSTRCAAPLFTGAISQNFNVLIPFVNSLCFDSILRDQGYHSELIVGHDADFGSLRQFFEFHAQSIIFDSKYFQSNGQGKEKEQFNDETVLNFSYNRILELHRSQMKFSVTLLTYDNHAPNGFASDKCKKDYGSPISDVIRCNSDLLAAFISKLKNSGVLENTVLVVLGDHPFMGVFPSLSDNRNIFSKIFTPLDIDLISNKLTPFDLPQTALEAMGFKSKKERFGLGSSAYSKHILQRDPSWNIAISKAFEGPPPPYYIDFHISN